MTQAMTDTIENVLFDEIDVGQGAQLIRRLTLEDIRAFAAVSGDVNPAHLDTAFANDSMFHGVIGHGMWTGSLVSTILGTQFPGPGTIYLEQSFRFKRPVRIGDTLTVDVSVSEKNPEKHTLTLDCSIRNQNGDQVVSGQAKVMAPTEKIIRPRMQTPALNLFDPQARVNQFVAELNTHENPVKMGIVHPTDVTSLTAACQLKESEQIDPLLIGPREKIEAVARDAGVSLNGMTIHDAKHSHEAAEMAISLAKEGAIEAIQRGRIDRQELLDPLNRCDALMTRRRFSHITRFDIPLYSKPLFLTDALLNLNPTLLEKVDMIQNAIDTAMILGIELPQVAILSAVDTIDPDYPSSLDAASLCKMHDRGQIQGGRLDGPLRFDHAVMQPEQLTQDLSAGPADIVVAPDSESANMLAKQLELFAGASSSGVMLGARVPLAMPMRDASIQSHMLSGIFAARVAAHYRNTPP